MQWAADQIALAAALVFWTALRLVALAADLVLYLLAFLAAYYAYDWLKSRRR